MPNSKHRKPKRNTNRSPIGNHKRSGKKLVPPLVRGMGEKLQLASWMNDRLPEMLWAALIFASMERPHAFNEFERIFDFVAGHPRKAELGNLTISGVAELDDPLRKDIISFITANRVTAQALSTLTMFESLPRKEEWEANLSGFEPSLPLLMTAVGNTLYHQSSTSTDCRWVRSTGIAAAGRMHVSPQLQEYADTMSSYPKLEPGSPEGARIRATEGALAALMTTGSNWPTNFWQEAWDKTPCTVLVRSHDTAEVRKSTTRQEISELIDHLKEHWRQTHSTTAIDRKHDATFGMTFYALRILADMMALGISNSILGRLGLRTILEIRINLKYLVDRDDDELWKTWRQYGAGQAKLSSLKLDDLAERPEHIDIESVESIASEDIWEELLVIDIGNWTNSDLRKMSEQVQLKDIYDQHYPWTSTYAHGMWGAIRESSYQTCGNPLHRLHRYPERQPLQDCLYDAVVLVDEIIRHVDNEFPTFSHRLLKPT